MEDWFKLKFIARTLRVEQWIDQGIPKGVDFCKLSPYIRITTENREKFWKRFREAGLSVISINSIFRDWFIIYLEDKRFMHVFGDLVPGRDTEVKVDVGNETWQHSADTPALVLYGGKEMLPPAKAHYLQFVLEKYLQLNVLPSWALKEKIYDYMDAVGLTEASAER